MTTPAITAPNFTHRVHIATIAGWVNGTTARNTGVEIGTEAAFDAVFAAAETLGITLGSTLPAARANAIGALALSVVAA